MPKAQAVTLRQNPVYPAPHGSWRGHSVKSSLQAIAARIAEGGPREGVVRMLDDLIRPLDPKRTEDQLVGAIAAALRKHAVGARTHVGNLYLREDELQHMRLYTLLREHVPMISMTHPLANELLLPHVSSQAQAVILDACVAGGLAPSSSARRTPSSTPLRSPSGPGMSTTTSWECSSTSTRSTFQRGTDFS